MELPKRKSTRLSYYDYSQNGAYFVTVCTHEKRHLLSHIVGEGLCALPKNILTPIGKDVESAIHFIGSHHPHVIVDKYVVMPNHIHMILMLDTPEGHGTPSLSNIVGQMKSYTTKLFGGTLWQRSFHDHIIRGEEDYKKIWQYIDTNVLRWEKDCFYSCNVSEQ